MKNRAVTILATQWQCSDQCQYPSGVNPLHTKYDSEKCCYMYKIHNSAFKDYRLVSGAVQFRQYLIAVSQNMNGTEKFPLHA